MTEHADLTARLRANATSLARRGIDPLGSAVASSARLRDAAAACTEAADALDAADAENARLTAERDALRTYVDGQHLLSAKAERERDEALAREARLRDVLASVIEMDEGGVWHGCVISHARAVLAVSEEATDAEGGSL